MQQYIQSLTECTLLTELLPGTGAPTLKLVNSYELGSSMLADERWLLLAKGLLELVLDEIDSEVLCLLQT